MQLEKLSNKALAKKLSASLERTNAAMSAIYKSIDNNNVPFSAIVSELGQDDSRVKKYNEVYAVRRQLQDEAYSRLGLYMTTSHMITILETTRRARKR